MVFVLVNQHQEVFILLLLFTMTEEQIILNFKFKFKQESLKEMCSMFDLALQLMFELWTTILVFLLKDL